ncbi:MAG: aminodeoxychorismate synthase component I [Rubricoccaceae bacterium]
MPAARTPSPPSAPRAPLEPAQIRALLGTPGTVLLDGPKKDADTRRAGALLFARPVRVLCADAYDAVPALLAGLDEALAAGHHVAGFLAYEAGYALEPTLFPEPPAPEGPLGWFGVYGPPEVVAPRLVRAALEGAGPVRLGPLRFAFSEAAYAARVDAVRAHIREGDLYQLNLTAPFRFALEGDPLGLYGALRARQRVAYGAFVRTAGDAPRGQTAVCSLSPELFFRTEASGLLTARPMKGTAPRGGSAAEDERLARALARDPKNRAENLMIVDLLRNDLARVAEPGSVSVPRLFFAERYETVTQMTSTVTARRRDGVSLGDLLRALFPCGSVTGAPRLRAMQRIRELEAGPRGVYCGAVGYAAPDGAAAFNVAIRTAVARGGQARYDVGSGIVWDSDAAAEFAECLLKARPLTDLVT